MKPIINRLVETNYGVEAIKVKRAEAKNTTTVSVKVKSMFHTASGWMVSIKVPSHSDLPSEVPGKDPATWRKGETVIRIGWEVTRE